jgi:hypothetical protein
MSNFRFVKNAAVWWPVRWQLAIDGGRTEEVSIELKFQRVRVSEIEEIRALENVDFVLRTAADWRGVLDEAGKPAPFERELVGQLMDQPGVAEAIGRAWGGFLTATPESRLGNSVPSPAGGPAAAAETADQTASPTA